MTTKECTFRFVHDFADDLEGYLIIDAEIGPDQDAILLAGAPAAVAIAAGRDTKNGASFARSAASQPYEATVLRRIIQTEKTRLTEITAAHPHAQPLRDGRTLIVGARCRYRDGAPEHNATIYDADGAVENTFTLGDGINRIQVTGVGRAHPGDDQAVWVSYFDEGIFGNYGWDDPIGATGLVCFDDHGSVRWQFSPPAGFDMICDCYALNVAENSVWCCYYTAFPVVTMSKILAVRGWANEIAGATAMAVDHRRVLLWGGYGQDRTRCVLQSLGDDRVKDPVNIDLRLPDGADILTANILGRGSVLHAFAGSRWYQIDLYEL